MGCEVRTRAEVTRLIERNGRIAEAEINGGEERVEADYFIADTHPAVALALITESAVIHNIFRKRICSLENTFGMFTASLVLRADAVPYLNRNIYIYRNDRVWGYSEYRPENINTCAMVSFQAPADNSRFTRNIDLITPMYPQEVAQWNDAPQGARGEDYRLYKSRKAEALIRLISEYVPGLSADVVERVYSSTLLTYSHYIGSPGGSAFGVRKNFESPMTTILSPRTPEPNLFFTGQSINLHGMLGVSVTSFLTCKEILGAELYRNLF
jgi:phytoene dehydrogenase-like protein